MNDQAAYSPPPATSLVEASLAPLPARGEAEERVTPMMAQYIEIKAANPDSLLFYRMGDFYELFFHDAEIASRTLGIVLTKRGKHQGEDIPMCGVPVVRADDYLQRLIAAGHRVAVCEQLEDPAEARKRGAKATVKRDVVRLVTPGTITEDSLLEPGRASLLVALARRRLPDESFAYGVAAVDISTGRFNVSEVDASGLSAELARLDPREIVAPDTVLDDIALKDMWRDIRAARAPLPRDGLDPISAERRLCDYFSVATLDAFGDFTRCEIAAAAAVLSYITRTQLDARPPLSPPRRENNGGVMVIDPATRANLELTRTLAGERTGSLLASIDRTTSPGGARLLAERLAGPLTDLATIIARQEAVTAFMHAPDLREQVRRLIASAPDMARALTRLGLGRGGPRDLAALRDGLDAALGLSRRLAEHSDLPPELIAARHALAELDPSLPAILRETLADELPLMKRDGGFVRKGHHEALDEARELQSDSRKVISALQARYAVDTGCRTLRVKHNNMIGYFVEVPQSFGEDFLKEPWNATFVHRQTMAGAMRFSTVELGTLEARIASAADRAKAIELGVFDTLTEQVVAVSEPIKAAADALAIIDVAAALADIAADLGWMRPVVDNSLAFGITGGRHPVVEAALKRNGEAFVANACNLSPPESLADGRIALVTGPNMAGKSTYLRQNALIAVLAQMGAYVPASSAHIGIVDRLFSRVGAADDLARGRSTFMVEMIETAAILNQAGLRALVILDEIGRGTATYDGLSIAWATIEHLHAVNCCRALFATHYHELTRLPETLERLTNLTVKVTEWHGDVVFLHEVIAGAADRSYGIQVAKLAGLPPAVTERARAILDALETASRERPTDAVLDDLPLFSAADWTSHAAAKPKSRLDRMGGAAQFVPANVPSPVTAIAPDALRSALQDIQPDELTPRQALEALYKLKSIG
jgi:DNA mismatch repair protein MutS